MFVKQKSIKQLWELHKEEFKKLYALEQAKPLTHVDLEKAFVDLNGKQYYRFNKSIALPIERLGKVKDYITYLSAALSGEELDKIFDKIDTLLTDGLTKGKNAAKIGALISEAKERKYMVIHTELIYNFLAVQYIREDEEPSLFNNDIHMQKVVDFKALENANHNAFFLNMPELKLLSGFTNTTPEEWMKLWEESIVKQEVLKQMLEKL